MAARLGIRRKSKLPLREISGLALRTMKGRAQICAIGDDSSTIVTGDITSDGEVAKFELHRVGRLLDRALRSDWEAIAADDAGNLFVLQENPARVLVLNAALNRLLCRIELRVDAREAELPKGWVDDDSSRGEGFLLLGNGHFLIVKEKDPPLLVEFGPRGSKSAGISPRLFRRSVHPLPTARKATYVPLQSWSIDSKRGPADLSDLAAFDGELYMISDEETCLVRLESKLPAKGGKARIVARWDLPKKIKNPEGLVFLKGCVPVIAVDRKKRKKNVFVLDRLRKRG